MIRSTDRSMSQLEVASAKFCGHEVGYIDHVLIGLRKVNKDTVELYRVYRVISGFVASPGLHEVGLHYGSSVSEGRAA